jgi:ribosome-binding ATPase YchF (GTP1/OBG family)
VLLKLETKKRKLKSTLDRIRDVTKQISKNGNASNNDEEVLMEGFQLITAKPVLYVCNVDENSS